MSETTSFVIVASNPCATGLNQIDPVPFYDRTHYFFDKAFAYPYIIEDIGETSTGRDCGQWQIEFYDADQSDPYPINFDLFDDGVASSDPQKYFTINELSTFYASIPVNATFTVGYKVSLVDYPESFFTNSF